MRTKKIFALLLALLSCQLYAQMRGDGSIKTPFQIETLEDFLQFRDTVNNGFRTACADLQTDIDLSSVCYEDHGNDTCVHWFPIGEGNNGTKYEGRFDGKGHVVRNLFVKSDVENFRGLFGATHKATLLNIGVENSYIHGGYYVGGLVGNGDSTLIINCYTRGDIFGYFISGIIGNAYDCSVRNCYSTCFTKGNYHSAIISYSVRSDIDNCFYNPEHSKTGVGYGEGNANATQTQLFQDGTIKQKLNDYVRKFGGDSLVLWKQDADSLPTFEIEPNQTTHIRHNTKAPIFSSDHHIYIISNSEDNISIYNCMGLIIVKKLSKGVNDLGYFPAGIFIINGQKIIVAD
ncbi:MAG: hypothetical protein MJZ33_10110 [Paludibacteraceae bacterium]|nr:hypothetical protein [Paludibacteraceae bacterium]